MKIKTNITPRKDSFARVLAYSIALPLLTIMLTLTLTIYFLVMRSWLYILFTVLTLFVLFFGIGYLPDHLYQKYSSEKFNLFKLKKKFIVYKKGDKFYTAFRTILGLIDSGISPEEEREFAIINYNKAYFKTKKPRIEKPKVELVNWEVIK